MNIKVKIGGADITKYVVLPIKWNTLLDERLDEGRLSLRNFGSTIEIGDPVTVAVGNSSKDFIVSAFTKTEIPVGSGRYNVELSVIEPTKMLERIVVETLTFSNHLGRNYGDGSSPAPFRRAYEDGMNVGSFAIKNPYTTPQLVKSTLVLPSIESVISPYPPINRLPDNSGGQSSMYEASSWWNSSGAKMSVIKPDGTTETIVSDSVTQNGKIVLNSSGKYTIIYRGSASWSARQNPTYTNTLEVVFEIDAGHNAYSATPKYTIRTVIERVLDLAEPHRAGDEPRFKLDGVQAVELDKITAPEFYFTQKTLKEILDQIGGFIHGIPRLIKGKSGEFDTIYFDMLGGFNKTQIDYEQTPYLTETYSQSIEDYATEIDSTVENLVNTLNEDEGSVVHPYYNGFETVRAEDMYVRIDESNMVIPTSLPIYRVRRIEVRLPSNGAIVDITPYIFEAAEYGRLSSFSGAYPTSKTYALYYTLGEKNIKGLSFKAPSAFDNATVRYAIYNILEAKLGDACPSYSGFDYPKLAFRVTYVPIFSARIKQHKIGVSDDFKSTIAYNQSANLVETRYYGENLKGVIARMGNVELSRVYRFAENEIDKIPKIGEVFSGKEDYYVSAVLVAVYPNSVDVEIGFSKDFNRLSEYVGVNSQWRAYEVSERTAYNRDYVYTDTITDNPYDWDVGKNNMSLLTLDWLRLFARIFTTLEPEKFDTAPTFATVETKDNDGEKKHVIMPVVTSAFGNTLCFTFCMQDNYSAGPQSVYSDSENTDVKGYWQTDVPYVDYYGRFETLGFTLGTMANTEYSDALGLDIPKYPTTFETAKILANTYDAPLVINKNGSEVLRVSYQLFFNPVIGSGVYYGSALPRAMAQLTSGKTVLTQTSLFVSDHEIGRFDTLYTPIGRSYLIKGEVTAKDGRGRVNVIGETCSESVGKAWVIARNFGDGEGWQILAYKNVDIKVGDLLNPNLNFEFLHKYYQKANMIFPTPEPDPGPDPTPNPPSSFGDDELLVKVWSKNVNWADDEPYRYNGIEVVDPRWGSTEELEDSVFRQGFAVYPKYGAAYPSNGSTGNITIIDNLNGWNGKMPPTKWMVGDMNSNKYEFPENSDWHNVIDTNEPVLIRIYREEETE